MKTMYFINDSNSINVELPTRRDHTASIDFCESNYLLSNVIVEPHNVWSSIVAFTVLGAVGIVCGNPMQEWRIFLMYFILLIIGIGSACLHATLDSTFQSFDELPMLYLIICSLYAVLEIDTPHKGERKYPNLPIYLFLLSCVCTAVYYIFQQLYVVFLITFISMTVVIFSLHIRIAIRLNNEVVRNQKRTRTATNNNRMTTTNEIAIHNYNGKTTTTKEIALRFYKLHHIAYTIIASPIWVMDQYGCNYLLPTYNRLPFPFTGMTLHVLWHFSSALGAHYFVQFLCSCRMDALGIVGDVRYVLGLLPVVIVVDDNIKPSSNNDMIGSDNNNKKIA